MSAFAADDLELISQPLFEQLEFLREYTGVLLDSYPPQEVINRLYQSAQSLAETTSKHGLVLFSEVADKLAQVFHYVQNNTIEPESCGPIVDFVQEGVALLESDLLQVGTNGVEAEDDILAFKTRYPFAFHASIPNESSETSEMGIPELTSEGAATDLATERVPFEPTSWVETPDCSSEAAASGPAPDMANPGQALDAATSDLAQGIAIPDLASEATPPTREPVKPSTDSTLEPAPPDSAAEASGQGPLVEAAVPNLSDAFERLPEDAEVPAEILEFFVPEAEEQLQGLTECLLELEANPDPKVINSLFRAMHTIKGSAAQVGLHRISHVAHHAEDLIGLLRDGALPPSAEIVDICLEVVDCLKKFLYSKWPDEATTQASVRRLLIRIAGQAPGQSTPEQTSEESHVVSDNRPVETSPAQIIPLEPAVVPVQPGKPVNGTAAESPVLPTSEPASPSPFSASPNTKSKSSGSSPSKSVRVPLDRLDRMMNAVGELVINRTRMLGRLTELERLAEILDFSKGRMTEKIGEFQDRYQFTRLDYDFNAQTAPAADRPNLLNRFSLAARYRGSGHTEFSELEWDRYDDFNILSRSLNEISADLTEVLTQLGRFVRQVDSDIDEFTKLAHRLQDEITEARMVPIGNLYTRLARTARDAAKAAGKQVELVLSGAETDLDNGIIQQISDPLIHLVRNSIAHGIETAEERVSRGKPAQGKVALRAYHRGNQICIEVEDDGRGLDYEKIRGTALTQGLVPPDVTERLTERELLEFLFRPGFSTAARKTELAGRGVGLDIVRANLTALHGEIAVETQAGRGTRFTLKVPLTLVITQALFLRNGTSAFGIPLACVEEIRRVRASEIEQVGDKLLTRVREEVVEVVRLDTRLGLEAIEPVNGFYRMVTVNVGGRRVGIIVEEVLRKDEIVIKGLGEYLRNVKLFSGATIASDGRPILLIDVNRFIAAESLDSTVVCDEPCSSHLALPSPAGGNCESSAQEKVILLADDSISVRRFVGRMLEKAGYRCKFACDGLEALEIVTQGPCHLVLTDLEMPRTSGYELMAHLRQNPATRMLPVIVLTSRAGAKHRDKAFKEGAAGFLTKPVQEEQLLAAVKKSLDAADPADPCGTVASVEGA